MLLRSIRVKNFRAIRSTAVDLDATTILIGENGSGKSSLLKAIGIALGNSGAEPFRVEANDFHQGPDGRPAGPIEIELRLREGEVGECDRVPSQSVAALLGPPSDEPREVILSVRAESKVEPDAIDVSWQIRSDHHSVGVDGAETLAWIRSAMPLIWIRGGTFKRVTPTLLYSTRRPPSRMPKRKERGSII